MTQDKRVSRRRMLKLTGVATSTAFVAGCGGGGNGNGGGGSGGGNGGGATDGFEISPNQDIRFSGQTQYWEGLQPSSIEGEQNPTLILETGETYSIGWTEGDGAAHNLELRNEAGDVVNDYTTGQPVTDPGNEEIFEFEVVDEIALYRCQPHPPMEGNIVIQGTAAGGSGNQTGGNTTSNETGGNQTGNQTGGNETGNQSG